MIFIFILLLITVSYSASQETDNCKCVIYYHCDREGMINIYGNNLIDERIRKRWCECGSCTGDNICCRLNTTTPPTTPPPTTPPFKSRTGCGFRNPEGINFKKGDSYDSVSVNFGEFPWMVGVLLDSGSYRCGGSLIHPSVVLTAAHCVTRKSMYIARAGEWDSSGTREILKHEDRTVASIKIHENYYPPLYHNDVALLFLNGSFELKAHISPVCLPPAETALDNVRCYVTGWGKDQFGLQGQFPNILKKIDLPLVEKNVCEANLRQTSLGNNFNLHRSALCAGGEKNKDACLGDGGGPLVCPVPGEDERYQQVGIVSWGIECNKENRPGVYSNVQVLREWIDKQMKEKNLDIGQYLSESRN